MASVRDMCQVRYVSHIVDDAWGGDVVAAACVQVAVTVKPELLEGTWITESFLDLHYDPSNPIEVVNGHIKLPKGPGFGVVSDENFISEPVSTFT